MAVQSKSFLASPWHQIDAEWAAELVGLGSFGTDVLRKRRELFLAGYYQRI